MEFTSRTAGQESLVAIYPDRIEWSGTGVLIGSSIRDDTRMIPLRLIHGVSTRQHGFGRSSVRVGTSGDLVEFRVSNRQAQEARDLLLYLARRLFHPAA